MNVSLVSDYHVALVSASMVHFELIIAHNTIIQINFSLFRCSSTNYWNGTKCRKSKSYFEVNEIFIQINTCP